MSGRDRGEGRRRGAAAGSPAAEDGVPCAQRGAPALRLAARLGLALAALAAVPAAARAEATGPCHCYRDRTFDPARPAAADEYILATTRSSLLSAAFGPSKRELVQAAMTGTSPDDLWIAHWAARRTGRDAGALLDEKAKAKGWSAVLGPAAAGCAVDRALARGRPDAEVAALIVDDVLVSRLGADAAGVAALRGAGAASGEVILSVLLARRLGTSPATVLGPVREGKATWGVVVSALGLTPKALDGVVRESVRS